MLKNITLIWRRFSPMESALFACVRPVLPITAVAIYDAQIAAIHHVQRASWTELCLYPRKHQSRGVSFTRTDEFALAEAQFSVHGTSYTAKLYCLRGYIFDIVVYPNPRNIAFSTWDSPAAVELLNDPMLTPSAPDRQPISEEWRDFLHNHAGEVHASWSLYDENSA